jgi:hypothetical protein
MVVSDFDRRVEGGAVSARGYSMPVHTIDFELLANQIVGIADHDPIGFRVEIDDIKRTWRTAWQPLALTDREQLDSVMFTDEIPIDVVNFAAVKFVFPQMRTQKRLVIVARNKTNFLAVDLVSDLEA